MRGRLQNVAAAIAAVSAFVLPAHAEGLANAGATVRDGSGWSASLFVTRPGTRDAAAGQIASVSPDSFVNAQLMRKLTRNTRLTLDVFNVLDKRPAFAPEDLLAPPADTRGLRLTLRITF